MKKLLTFAAFVMAVICVMAQDNVASKFPEFPGSIKIDLWPDGAPTKTGREGTLPVVNPTWAENVTQAELFVYPAKKPNGQVLLIAPAVPTLVLPTEMRGTISPDGSMTWA